MTWACSAIFSCRQPYETARNRAIRVVGVARMTFCATPNSINSGSCSKAALKKFSPGRKSTTNSGEGPNCSQYDLLASCPKWVRT